MIGSVLLALHLLGAVVWVGGMGFALLVLRPSLAVLEPPQRLALHGQVFRRFFRIIWHAMPVMLLTGYAMLFLLYGGFGGVNWAVNVMHLTGLIMAGLFLAIFFGPWRGLRAALDAGDRAAAAPLVDRIRQLIQVNLVLGLLTVVVAAFR
ncbi:CopD family protein [Limobrevibacterium gyesilva]|uniref:CopD family protein n=1 Tax=Limobrevibacterium gyesilva TaxID=2991712 RepID=A0AA41YTJ9_9PROT|nr:CopD family protein [Limobrevibacterium gyesilva]MCW3475182.1 CopD family protein [Limobrevibacterium gyesilva]